MIGTWQFIAGSVAALLYVRTPETTGESQALVWTGKEKGAVTGRRDAPIAQSGWPPEVLAEIERHFQHVFSLEHEHWEGRRPTPRAAYCDQARSWEITVHSLITP